MENHGPTAQIHEHGFHDNEFQTPRICCEYESIFHETSMNMNLKTMNML